MDSRFPLLCEVGGDGQETPLVVLHGLFGQSRNFKSWARSVTSDPDCGPRRVVLADLRNHGSSEQRDSMTSGRARRGA